MPKDVVKYIGEYEPSLNTWLASLQNQFMSLDIPADKQVAVAAANLDKAAAEWYHEFYNPDHKVVQWSTFVDDIKKHFAVGDANQTARAGQRTLRLLKFPNNSLIDSLNAFMRAWITNQSKIKDQSQSDEYFAIMEALKNSARDYPIVQQLITQIASSLSSKQSHEITAKGVHEAAVRIAVTLHDTPTYTDNNNKPYMKRNTEQRNILAPNLIG